MVRAPCCEKMGLKKGPWTPEEDRILVSYILTYGHGNWRALPKQAGLLRCGKSCRLRWTNYLRPDIKRGDFSKEEEETIIHLHAMLGNRWSAIAAKLPGRTDNEIKNLWHTHLKKSLNPNQITTKISRARAGNSDKNKSEEQISSSSSESACSKNGSPSFEAVEENGDIHLKEDCIYGLQELLGVGEDLWTEAFGLNGEEEVGVEEEDDGSSAGRDLFQRSSSNDDGIRFWMSLLAESANLELFN